LSDENVPTELIDWLSQKGFNISGIVSERLFGTDDLDIIVKAFEEKRIIITLDSDFGKIIFTQKIDFFAIVYLRPGHFNGDFHIATIETIIRNLEEVTDNLIIIGQRKGNKIKVRIRHL